MSRFLLAFEGLLAGAAFALADALACGLPLDGALPAWIAASGLLLGALGAAVGALSRRPGVATGVVVLLAHGLHWSGIASKEWLAALPPEKNALLLALVAVSALATAFAAYAFVHGTLRLGAILVTPALVPACVFASTFWPHAAWPGLAFAFAPALLVALLLALVTRVAPQRGPLAIPALLIGLYAGTLHPAFTAPRRAPRARPAPAATRGDAEAPDLLLVIVDTLRADAVGRGSMSPGTPSLDRLAADGVDFTQAVASAAWTLPSHGSLFTSRVPADHAAFTVAARLRDDAPTLAQTLHDAGYATAAFTGGGFMVPATGFDRGFDEFDERAELPAHVHARHTPLALRVARNRFAPLWPVVNTIPSSGGLARVAARAEEWFRRRDRSRPSFLLLHTYQVHDYYLYDAGLDASGESALAARPRFAGRFAGRLWVHPDEIAAGCSEEEVAAFRGIYARRVALADAAIGAFVERARAEATDRPLVVVVTSDHGEGFDVAERRFMHGGRLHDDLLRVPLVVCAPGFLPAGRTIDAQVRLVDLMPTLLDFAGVPAPSGIEGSSLRRLPAEGDEPRAAWSEDGAGAGRQASLRTAGWKLIQRGEPRAADGAAGGAAGSLQAFDLAADPLERSDRAASVPPALRARLAEWWRLHPPHAAADAQLDAATREQLRQLGYVK